MNWDNLEGKRINGLYLGLFPFRGIVESSRVKYGGKVQHTVRLAEPITVYGAERTVVLIDEISTIYRILDEVDAEYARSINDSWYDDAYELE